MIELILTGSTFRLHVHLFAGKKLETHIAFERNIARCTSHLEQCKSIQHIVAEVFIADPCKTLCSPVFTPCINNFEGTAELGVVVTDNTNSVATIQRSACASRGCQKSCAIWNEGGQTIPVMTALLETRALFTDFILTLSSSFVLKSLK